MLKSTGPSSSILIGEELPSCEQKLLFLGELHLLLCSDS